MFKIAKVSLSKGYLPLAATDWYVGFEHSGVDNRAESKRFAPLNHWASHNEHRIYISNSHLALGSTAPEIPIDSLGPLHIGTIQKTLFSMVTVETKGILNERSHVKSVVLFGIEVASWISHHGELFSSMSFIVYSRMSASYKLLSTFSILASMCTS